LGGEENQEWVGAGKAKGMRGRTRGGEGSQERAGPGEARETRGQTRGGEGVRSGQGSGRRGKRGVRPGEAREVRSGPDPIYRFVGRVPVIKGGERWYGLYAGFYSTVIVLGFLAVMGLDGGPRGSPGTGKEAHAVLLRSATME